MICPHCKKEGWLPYQSQRYLESYGVGQSCLTVTECCNKPVTVKMVVQYAVTAYVGDKKEDDWGREIK
jgi:hypothetical protein